MPALRQFSFAGGEIADAVAPRSDSTKVSTGASTMLNLIVTRSGAAANRAGTRYVGECKDAHDDLRVVPFHFNDAQTYILEFGANYFRVWKDAAAVTVEPDPWDDTGSPTYVPGDIVENQNDATSHHYCVATHVAASGTNDPDTAGTEDDFWYQLTSVAADTDLAIVEVPTPYAQADLSALRFTQSADVITVTHEDHPPHEIIRSSDTFWTCLPKRFAPMMTAPTDITSSGGTGTAKNIRYKVTAVRAGTFEESAAGGDTSSMTDALVTNAESATLDLNIDTSGTGNHGLSTDDEIFVSLVETQSTSRANENAVRLLENRPYRITKVDADNFTLNGTAGLLTFPAIADSGSYPDIQIDYEVAFEETVKDSPTRTRRTRTSRCLGRS